MVFVLQLINEEEVEEVEKHLNGDIFNMNFDVDEDDIKTGQKEESFTYEFGLETETEIIEKRKVETNHFEVEMEQVLGGSNDP